MVDLPVSLAKRMGMRMRERLHDGTRVLVDVPESQRFYHVKILKSDEAYEYVTEDQFIETMDALHPDTMIPFMKYGPNIFIGGVDCLDQYTEGGFQIG